MARRCAAGMTPRSRPLGCVQTTMKYLRYAPRPDDARLVAEAFRVSTDEIDSAGAPAARSSADPGNANDRQDGVPCGMANLRNQTS